MCMINYIPFHSNICCTAEHYMYSYHFCCAWGDLFGPLCWCLCQCSACTPSIAQVLIISLTCVFSLEQGAPGKEKDRSGFASQSVRDNTFRKHHGRPKHRNTQESMHKHMFKCLHVTHQIIGSRKCKFEHFKKFLNTQIFFNETFAQLDFRRFGGHWCLPILKWHW